MLQLDPGTLSPLLKRLEASGLLRRERDARDERALAVTLTNKGRALRSEAETVPAAVVARLGMDLEELRALHESLTRVIAVAQAAVNASGQEPYPVTSAGADQAPQSAVRLTTTEDDS
jgi:DNA-binding MarR family transcriptional regulator